MIGSIAELLRGPNLGEARGNVWGIQKKIFQVPGTTTDGTTAYSVADSVGTGQKLDGLGGPNLSFLLHDAFLVSDVAVPATSSSAVNLHFFDKKITTAQTDNSALSTAGDERLAHVGCVQYSGQQGFASATSGLGMVQTTLSVSPRRFYTHKDGWLWMLVAANGAFTLGANAVLYVVLIYQFYNPNGLSN